VGWGLCIFCGVQKVGACHTGQLLVCGMGWQRRVILPLLHPQSAPFPADVSTVLASYVVMLLYIAVALGRFPRSPDWRDLLVHSRQGRGIQVVGCGVVRWRDLGWSGVGLTRPACAQQGKPAGHSCLLPIAL